MNKVEKKIPVIAELCQNHNGNIKIVEEMVHAAAEAGATFAKIQSIRSIDLTHRARFDSRLVEGGRVKVIKRPYKEEYERLSKLDLSESDHFKFLEICKKFQIKPMTTIPSLNRINFLKKAGFENIKLSSFDCISFPMIKKINSLNFKKIIISTGASYDREISLTARIMKSHRDFTLLHCISIYPTPLIEANLNRIKFLKKFCSKVGVSDHSNPDKTGYKLCVAAVDVGAEIVEKHFTILPKDKTRDGPVSVNAAQLKELVQFVNMSHKDRKKFLEKSVPEFKSMLGEEKRELSEIELLNRDYYQGRFSSRDKENNLVFNWEEFELDKLQ